MAQIDAVVAILRDVLGDDAIGAYLHGSTALARLRPHSDIDILALSRRPTTNAERERLIRSILPISGSRAVSGPSRSIELTIVVEADVRPWRYPPTLDFQHGDWWRPEYEAGDLAPWTTPNPDLATVLTMVREADRPAFGPAASEAFDPVPRADLDRAVVEAIPGLLEDLEQDTANVVLTFARIWTTLATGRIRPKDVAAAWALRRLPEGHRPVLERARDVYLGDHADTWDDLTPRIRPHVDRVLCEIGRVRRAVP
jgi:predicted nucleotidyltransferase